MKLDNLELRARMQPLEPAKPVQGPGTHADKKATKSSSFSEALAQQLANRKAEQTGPGTPSRVEFSAHAISRLQERQITLSPQALDRLDHGVELASSKGANNTLVMMDDNAFIVNVKNRKVITAITKDAAVDNVFTQIDSATIV
jgi:flagellar operon protein